MLAVLYIFLGAGLGGVLRHGVNLFCLRQFGPGFPWGTLSVNVIGSFLIGCLAAWLAFRAGPLSGADGGQNLRLFLVTGLLGGFTTFSAFSLDFALLWERGAMAQAGVYVLASVGLSLAGVFAGLLVVRASS